uniref:LMWPc domain-containing protein n=1 Tax=Nippostrongylus brasiliensis TaxID=27835 RepID=A0A0N4YJW7_NIPBR
LFASDSRVLGNICRSPIAEAVFLDIIKKRGVQDEWKVDSSAIIDFHTGKGPDRRAMSTLKKFGITDYQHRARVTSTADIREFDYIFGMDNSNISDLRDLEKQTEGKAKIELLGKYDPEGHLIVPDPYYEAGDEMNQIKDRNMSSQTSLVMYLVLRRDLMSSLGWPMGAVCTQAAHAASAVMWIFRNDPNTELYAKELDSMHKVTLGVWVEDGQSVCIALKPYPKDQVKNAMKGLKLF